MNSDEHKRYMSAANLIDAEALPAYVSRLDVLGENLHVIRADPTLSEQFDLVMGPLRKFQEQDRELTMLVKGLTPVWRVCGTRQCQGRGDRSHISWST